MNNKKQYIRQIKYMAVVLFLAIMVMVGINPLRIMANDVGDPPPTVSPQVTTGNSQKVLFTIPADLQDYLYFEGGASELVIDVPMGASIPMLPQVYGEDGNPVEIGEWMQEDGSAIDSAELLAKAMNSGESLQPLYEVKGQDEPTQTPEPEATGEPAPAETTTPAQSETATPAQMETPTPSQTEEDPVEPENESAQMILSPDPETQTGSVSYNADEDGLKSALHNIYQHGNGEEYTLSIGGRLDISASEAHMGRNGDSGEIYGYSDMTFCALAGKAGRLIFDGGEGVDAELLFSSEQPTYFGTPVTFGNISYDFQAFHMNGKDLLLGENSYILTDTEKDIHAGGDGDTGEDNSVITINATGAGLLNLHGGRGETDAYVTMDIDAPDAHLGTLTGGQNTVMIIKDVKAIGGIDTDGASANFVTGGEHDRQGSASVGDAGIRGLASLSIDGFTLSTSGDIISDGDIVLEEGGVLSAGGSVDIGRLVVNGNATLHTPAGSFTLAGYEVAESARLHAVITSGGKTAVNGRWFGNNEAYVLFNLTGGANADMGPLDIQGEYGDTELICDSSAEHVLLLPGSIYDIRVTEGEGSVSHDVDGAGNSPADGSVSAYCLVPKDTGSYGFTLVIPSSKGIQPTFTFTPETETSGSWIKGVQVDGTTVIDEQLESGADSWTAPGGEGRCVITAAFSNAAELHAVSRIITESEAKAIEGLNSVKELNEASGRPSFGHSINSALIADIQAGLDDGETMREHEITYMAGVMDGSGDNYITETVKIVVVPDEDTEITEDGQYALYAKDTSMSIDTLHSIEDEQQLAAYTSATLISANGDMDDDDIVVSEGTMENISYAAENQQVPVLFSVTTTSGSLMRGIGVQGFGDVCRIGDTYYTTLEDAIEAAYNTYAPTTIELVVSFMDVYYMDINHAITGSTSYPLTIKTSDELGGGKTTIYFMPSGSSPLINIYGSRILTLENVILSGEFLLDQDVELIHAKTNSIHNSFTIKNSRIVNFDLSRPLITIATPNCSFIDTLILGVDTTSSNGMIYSTQPYSIENTSFGSGSISLNSAVNGSLLNHVGNMDLYFENALIMNNTVGANGYAVNLPYAPQYLAYCNHVYNNFYSEEQRNVYLGQAHTAYSNGFFLYTPANDESFKNGRIGFMTPTSTSNGGIGVEGTIVAAIDYIGTQPVPDGYKDILTHDQRLRNPYALGVLPNATGEKLVLGQLAPPTVEFTFTKVDAADHSNLLGGAEFVLYACEEGHSTHAELVTDSLIAAGSCWQPVMDGSDIKVFTSDSDGFVDIGGLETGKYMLVEHKAPVGFMRPTGQWLVEADTEASGNLKLIITGVGEQLPPAFARDSGTNELLLPNMPSFKVANSGDGGIRNIIITGVLLIAAAATLFVLERRRQPKAH